MAALQAPGHELSTSRQFRAHLHCPGAGERLCGPRHLHPVGEAMQQVGGVPEAVQHARVSTALVLASKLCEAAGHDRQLGL